MRGPRFKTVKFTRIRAVVILHLQLWLAKLTRKSSESREACDATRQWYSLASSVILNTAEDPFSRTYDIRESPVQLTSKHSLYGLGADDDLVGPLVIMQESSVDMDDCP